MKDKRQQREEDDDRQFRLPTGGVDISQLTALGICPPPFHLPGAAQGTPSTQLPHVSTDVPVREQERVPASLPMGMYPPNSTSHPHTSHLPRGNDVTSTPLMVNTSYPAYMNAPYAAHMNFSGKMKSPKDMHRNSPYDSLPRGPTVGRTPATLHAPFPVFPGYPGHAMTSTVPPLSAFQYVGLRS